MSAKKSKSKAAPSENKSIKSGYFQLILAFLAFLLYAGTLSHEYAQDDDIYTRKNTYVQQGISSFPKLISQGSLVGFDGTNVADYRPLVLVTFALEKSLFGNSPKAGHFINILLYIVCSLVLFALCKKLFRSYPPYLSFLITLLFVVHPIHTEVVANIKSRDELLCFLFGVMSLNYGISYAINKNVTLLVVSAISFFAALLCKENGFAYLVLLPVLLYFFTELSIKKIAQITSVFLLVAGINLAIRAAVLDSLFLTKQLVLMDNSLMAASNYSERLATTFTMLLKAISLLFVPLNLSFDYSYNQFPVVGWADVSVLLSVVIHLGLAFLAIIGLKSKSFFSFAILFYFISYSLTANVLYLIGSSFAERFLFAPSFAFCVALPFLLALIFKVDLKSTLSNTPFKMLALVSVVIILFGFKTVSRAKVWKNNHTLFESGIESAPNSARVHYAYANEFRETVEASADMYVKMEAASKGLSEFKKGLAIYDKDERIYYNMGVIYYNINQLDSAKIVYNKAIRMKPDYAEALNNLGVIYFNEKKYTEAQSYFKKATESNAQYSDAFANLGACYHNTGDANSAIPFYKKAAELNPSNSNVLRNLSMAYNAIGDSAMAAYYNQQAAQ
ncbi:MAG: tetratricopeptide repeat protein [Bacteroidetes bacterium]|nr:tetratricopeptide repeat protein [Bacteroidota bacterium]